MDLNNVIDFISYPILSHPILSHQNGSYHGIPYPILSFKSPPSYHISMHFVHFSLHESNSFDDRSHIVFYVHFDVLPICNLLRVLKNQGLVTMMRHDA
jgi:hypothetical protein